MPFSFEIEGLQGKLDAKRKRYAFEVNFHDLTMDSVGKANSILVIDTETNKAFFESFTIELSKPRIETFRLVEQTFSESDKDKVSRFNKP